MVASARLRVAQSQLMEARPYAQKMNEMICQVAARTKDRFHPLLGTPQSQREVRMVLTSDKGMCGGFNIQPLQLVTENLSEFKAPIDFLCCGRKGLDFFRRSGIALAKQWAGFWQDLNWYHADGIAQDIMDEYIKGRWSKVTVVFNRFKSAIAQETVRRVLLPLPDQSACEDKDKLKEYYFEPDPEKIFEHLLPRYIKVTIWHVLLESKAAEQAARMQAMENATESAGEMIEDMVLQLNRARQAAITSEISELVGSAEAING